MKKDSFNVLSTFSLVGVVLLLSVFAHEQLNYSQSTFTNSKLNIIKTSTSGNSSQVTQPIIPSTLSILTSKRQLIQIPFLNLEVEVQGLVSIKMLLNRANLLES